MPFLNVTPGGGGASDPVADWVVVDLATAETWYDTFYEDSYLYSPLGWVYLSLDLDLEKDYEVEISYDDARGDHFEVAAYSLGTDPDNSDWYDLAYVEAPPGDGQVLLRLSKKINAAWAVTEPGSSGDYRVLLELSSEYPLQDVPPLHPRLTSLRYREAAKGYALVRSSPHMFYFSATISAGQVGGLTIPLTGEPNYAVDMEGYNDRVRVWEEGIYTLEWTVFWNGTADTDKIIAQIGGNGAGWAGVGTPGAVTVVLDPLMPDPDNNSYVRLQGLTTTYLPAGGTLGVVVESESGVGSGAIDVHMGVRRLQYF